jgi:hypothetical protein
LIAAGNEKCIVAYNETISPLSAQSSKCAFEVAFGARYDMEL